jgi:ABC-type cobalamin/Fe3+-siderophores transport system ATPase subunit
LLVGMNNSGKTSVLEAIQLLIAQENLKTLWDAMISKGEYVTSSEYGRELDIRHLFYGHNAEVGNSFSISAEDHDVGEVIFVEQQFSSVKGLQLLLTRNSPAHVPLTLSSGGYLPMQPKLPDSVGLGSSTYFIKSSSLTAEQMIDLFDQVVLTPEEDLVIEALKIIEPNIERIAVVTSEENRYPGSRSGFAVRLANSHQRIPIGSMGDGMWHMLGIALALVQARHGFLLVDDIDTGFHFSTLSNMWKLIWETAKRLDIQVFATTHNSDCWTSLAEIANTENPGDDGIMIHRIEKGKPSSVVFTERQVVIAAERGIEVR